MHKVIIDTNIFYSAIGFDGSLLDLVILLYSSNNFQIYFSEFTYSELLEKMYSSRFYAVTKNRVPKAFVQNHVKLIKLNSHFVQPTTKIELARDLDDNMFLELALEINPNYLISGDKDLLELKEFEGTKILKPSKFIEELQLLV